MELDRLHTKPLLLTPMRLNTPTSPIQWCFTRHAFWFRIFGYGIGAKNTLKHRLYFSERNGYCKRVMVGVWSIKWLEPCKGEGAERGYLNSK